MYYRSMTLQERAAYEATIREWFPTLTLVWQFETDYPNNTPGDVDTQDPFTWHFYRNGFYAAGNIIDQCIVYSESEDGIFHFYDAFQARQMIREIIFSSNEIMFPLVGDPAPDSLTGRSAGVVRRVGA